MRTNIEIDDKLMEDAFEYSGLPTKRAVVEEALRMLVRMGAQRRLNELQAEGMTWEGDLDDWRTDKEFEKDR